MMKNIKWYKMAALFIIAIVIILLYYHWHISININDESKLLSKLEKRENVSNSTILKTYKEDDLLYTLSTTQDNMTCIHIGRKDFFFRNRYILGEGSKYTSDSFGTRLTENSKEATIVVFIDNRKFKAYKYTLDNGDSTYNKIIQNEEFIIDVYKNQMHILKVHRMVKG
ncbi:MAG: hypothetical protein WCD89_05390 [Anaerocolumna sp.]